MNFLFTKFSHGFAEFVERERSLILLLAISTLLVLHGCSFLPGMYVIPDKVPDVAESRDESAKVDYTLLKITPLLLRELAEAKTLKQGVFEGTLLLPKSDSYPYRLGSQDVLRIFVWGNPDLTPVTTTVTTSNVAATPAGRTVDDNGNIFFPLVGSIRAAGLTVSQFRQSLSKQLGKYIKDPQVEVDVAGFRSQKVFVSGQVKTPGIIPITDQPMLLTDALGLAGGTTDVSDLYAVVLTRGNVSVTVDLDKLYYDGDLSVNVPLQNGDVISVPDRMMRKVFVLGEVGNSVGANQARSYVMRRGRMSLTEVLSDAGGVSPYSAASNEIYLMRTDKNGKPLVYLLDATQPQALLLAEQFPVEPRDVIFINPTGPTMIGRFIGQFLPLIQTVNTAKSTPF